MQCPRESISSRVRKFSNVPLYAKTRRTTHVGTHAYARMHICTHEFMCTHTGDCVDVMIGKGPGFLWLVVFRSENVKRSNIKSYRDLIIFFFFFFWVSGTFILLRIHYYKTPPCTVNTYTACMNQLHCLLLLNLNSKIL